MSAASGMCGSSSGLAVERFACDGQTCGDPAPARTRSLPAEMLIGERDPGLRGAAARLLGRRPACPASRPAAPLAPHTPAIHAPSVRTSRPNPLAWGAMKKRQGDPWMSPPDYGRSLRGLGINMLVP